MIDFLTFRRMVTPLLIQVIFWVGVVASVIAGISVIVAHHAIVDGLVRIIVGPLLVRIGCELLILFFRINETLTDIRTELEA